MKYVTANMYVDKVVHKEGVQCFPGCLEHATTIWKDCQKVKTGEEDLQVIWLDLVNAYGSVSHQLPWQALQICYALS